MKRKPLSRMTEEDLLAEMSIAGDREKMRKLLDDTWALVKETIDETNPADLINAKLVMERVIAEIKLRAKWLAKRTGQKFEI